MKKLISIFLMLIISISVGAFSGCGKKSDKLEFCVNGNTTEYNIALEFKNAYNKINPDVEIEIVRITEDYNTYIRSNYAANTLGDIIFTLDDTVAYLSSKNVFKPLDDLIEKDKIDTSIYYDSIMEIARPLPDGKTYFMPRDYNKVVTYIDKDMFEAAGIAIPSNNWTWNDFLDICKQFRTKMDADLDSSLALPVGLNPDSYPIEAKLEWKAVYYPIIKGFGESIFDANGNVVLGDENNSDGIAEMNKLISSRYAINPNDSDGYLFKSGQAAMLFGSRPTLASLKDKNIDFLPFPALENNAVGMGCSGYAINNKSNKIDKAWDFLKFIISEDGQKTFSKTGACVPMIESMKNDSGWTSYISSELNHSAFIDFPERDTVTNYMPMLNANIHAEVYAETDKLLKQIYYEPTNISNLLKDYKSFIALKNSLK